MYRVIAQIFLNIIRNVILLIHYDFIPFPFPSSIIRTRKTLSCCSRFGGKKYKEQGIGNNSGKLDRVNSLPFYYFPSPLLSFHDAKGSRRILGIPLFNDRAGEGVEIRGLLSFVSAFNIGPFRYIPI